MSIFYSKEQDGTLNVHVSGYLTKDPKVTEKVVLFSVCYGKKKYMDCRCWANDTVGQIASCLEQHDSVSVDGIFESYTGRDGKTHNQLSVDAVIPIVIPSAPRIDTDAQQESIPREPVKLAEITEQDEELPF